MDEQRKQAAELAQHVNQAVARLKIPELTIQLEALQGETLQNGFWDKAQQAQVIMQEISKLESRVKPWNDLQTNVAEINELLQLDDACLEVELNQQLHTATTTFNPLKEDQTGRAHV